MPKFLSIGSIGQAVKEVQSALNLKPSSLPALKVDGNFGPKTKSKVVEFQQRNGLVADGIVGPLTLDELLRGLFPPPQVTPGSFTGCDATQMRTITDDIERAKQFLDNVLSMLPLAPFLPKIGQVVKNVFLIDVMSFGNPVASAFASVELLILRSSYAKLRASLEQSFPKVCETQEGLFAAFVSDDHTDPTMHFRPRYFDPNEPSMFDMTRAATIIHERAHTILNLVGHPGTGDGPIAKPHIGMPSPPMTHDLAMKNAYCYEWLAEALHPTYDASKFPGIDVVTTGP